MIRLSSRWIWVVLGLIAIPSTGSAHLVDSGVAPFYDGWMHFWYSPLDWLPVFTLGLIGGFSGLRTARLTFWALVSGWLAGAWIGWNGTTIGSPELIGGIITLALGSWSAAGRSLVPWIATTLAVLTGLLLGSGNGAAVAVTDSSPTTVAGMVVGGTILLLWTSAIAATRPDGWQRLTLRVLGSWSAAVGLLSLAWQFRPG